MIKKVPYGLSVTEVNPPPSKSFAQRAIMAACLCHEPTQLKNLGKSDDVQHILAIAEQLGAEIQQVADGLVLTPRKKPLKTSLNCGESGLGIRMTTPILSTFGEQFTIEAKGSLLKRPLSDFEDILPQMGVQIKTNKGFAPLEISGTIQGGTIEVDGSLSSQYITGLLMALPLASQDSILKVKNPTSTPYLQMTLDLLSEFGIEIKQSGFQEFKIRGKQKYQSPTTYRVENDWSAAAFWVVYGAIKQSIKIQSLNPKSSQADKKILDFVEQAGASLEWDKNTLSVHPSPLKGLTIDATHCPDLFPILATLCVHASESSTIKGIQRLTHKESNRAETIRSEFHKLGAIISLKDNKMTIAPAFQLNSTTVSSHNDHRIAMALAIAATTIPNGLSILEAEAVNKSYPTFWEDLDV